jgi:hypothetical protein
VPNPQALSQQFPFVNDEPVRAVSFNATTSKQLASTAMPVWQVSFFDESSVQVSPVLQVIVPPASPVLFMAHTVPDPKDALHALVFAAPKRRRCCFGAAKVSRAHIFSSLVSLDFSAESPVSASLRPPDTDPLELVLGHIASVTLACDLQLFQVSTSGLYEIMTAPTMIAMRHRNIARALLTSTALPTTDALSFPFAMVFR